MSTRLPYATVCDAFGCTVEQVLNYKTILPNGTQLSVHLCDFHALELEEIDFDMGKVYAKQS